MFQPRSSRLLLPFALALGAVAWLGTAEAAQAAIASVESVRYDAEQGQLVIHADGPVSVRTSRLDHPARLVVDVPDARLAPGAAALGSIPGTAVWRVRVGQFKPTVARIVLDLTASAAYAPRVDGDDVRIPLRGGSGAAASAPSAPARPPAAPRRGRPASEPAQATSSSTWAGAPTAPLMLRRVGREWQLVVSANSRVGFRTTSVGDDRIHLDLEGGRVGLPRDSVYIDNGLIARVRSGQGPNGGQRLTIDLDQPVRHVARALPGGQAVLLTLGRVDKDRVTIDPGHGGTDDGALGQHGTKEKDVTLAIAKRLSRLMEAGGMSVQMTRMKDLEVLLRPRVEMANRNDSDVFVSIHANSFGAQHGVRGIETYYFSDESYALAQAIHQHLVTTLKQPDRGIRKNNFYVVHHTDMPAALIEIGYLSNATDEAQLADPRYQERAAQAIYNGIRDFLKNRQARP